MPLPCSSSTLHRSSQRSTHHLSSIGSYLKRSTFWLKSYWPWLPRSGGILKNAPPRKNSRHHLQKHKPLQHTRYPPSQWAWSTNDLQLSRRYHFGRLRLHSTV